MNQQIKPAVAEYDIERSIISHPGWAGNIAGLEGEALVKGKSSYAFIIRQGEKASHYYVTFMAADGSIRHQPFAIIYTQEGWHCRQGAAYGPFISQTIDDLIHRIIHCQPQECKPIRCS